MLVTEPRRDFTQTSLRRAGSIGIGDIQELFESLRRQAQRSLCTEHHQADLHLLSSTESTFAISVKNIP
jgi:hypothetical protein